ncbi:MAG: LUD domain-containing protein [Anaerolineae bacterium]|nr:lactate utilization protein [Chloroflexota bacterium]MBV6435226.1 Lactate utilization protein C [Anaerolineae bacterium]MDL1917288.1 lactate utilization protein [Anaerolineae bacterium CFX4]MBW7878910.1 LUD domain-containing protein [Anaerolineae bacterium]MCO6445277.1 LUD domain-containing protein [Anaerolineae bacterium]
MSSRESILKRLRAVEDPALNIPDIPDPVRVVPMADTSPAALREAFSKTAARVGVTLWSCAGDASALEQVLALIGDDKQIIAWDAEHIPLEGLAEALDQRGITRADVRDSSVRVGLTGVEAALAGTGSLVVSSGPGKPRSASLLPPVHIAVVRTEQIMPDVEAWFAQMADAGLSHFRQSANHVFITGGSRTADIAQELILGAHGPVEVHVVLVG